MEGMAAHEVHGREGKAILALNAIIGKEGLGSCFEFPEIVPAFLGEFDIFLDDFFVVFDLSPIFFEST